MITRQTYTGKATVPRNFYAHDTEKCSNTLSTQMAGFPFMATGTVRAGRIWRIGEKRRWGDGGIQIIPFKLPQR